MTKTLTEIETEIRAAVMSTPYTRWEISTSVDSSSVTVRRVSKDSRGSVTGTVSASVTPETYVSAEKIEKSLIADAKKAAKATQAFIRSEKAAS